MERAKKPSGIAVSQPAPAPTIDFSSDNSKVSAKLPSGENVTILLYGATIISWKSAGGVENLWLSDKALLDGSKAVRGGIPLVFPVFGPPPKSGHATSALPQHGFARTTVWEYLGKSTSESQPVSSSKGDDSIQLDFGLDHSSLSPEASKAWPSAFALVYSVTLSKEGLKTTMVVRNEGEETFEFQILLHTYLRVKDISSVSLSGLTSSYVEKTSSPPATKPASTADVKISKETDRVYTSVPGPVKISEGGKPRYELTRETLDDVVVWNPWTEKSKGMADFAPADGYKQMICVEAGAVNGWQKLEPGDAFEGGQIIKSLV